MKTEMSTWIEIVKKNVNPTTHSVTVAARSAVKENVHICNHIIYGVEALKKGNLVNLRTVREWNVERDSSFSQTTDLL